MTSPAMRTARMWSSLKIVNETAAAQKLTLAVAYVDFLGRTLLLWRNSQLPTGMLTQAEGGAWTAIVRYQKNIALSALFAERLQSNAINKLQDCDCITPKEVDGGELLLVDNSLIGAVCAVDQYGNAAMSQVAAKAYMELYSAGYDTPDIRKNFSHFANTGFGLM